MLRKTVTSMLHIRPGWWPPLPLMANARSTSSASGTDIDSVEAIEELERRSQLLQEAAAKSRLWSDSLELDDFNFDGAAARSVEAYADQYGRSFGDFASSSFMKDMASTLGSRASGSIFIGKAAMDQVLSSANKKGDVLTVAEVAGVMAAKRSADLLPHRLSPPISKVTVTCQPQPDRLEISVVAHVVTDGETTGEMEALTGVTVACLTLYDMCKAVNKNMLIQDIKLLN